VADFIGTMNTVGKNSFRPEEVRVVPLSQSSMRGQVISSFFLGDHNRVQVRLDSAEEVVLKLPPKLTFTVGDSIGLEVDTGSLVC
jgi:ABC-type Fe3+/spermidine/putrescine transport system ATPase subunit